SYFGRLYLHVDAYRWVYDTQSWIMEVEKNDDESKSLLCELCCPSSLGEGLVVECDGIRRIEGKRVWLYEFYIRFLITLTRLA
ncbi:hypothetical protein, partial [Candidatus Hakubella thermalkaliphila]|uniref:hypothetical protein n=1 Tax=Candidatus Hakubella thermalkaliphila TaxID=2754717 RepID=UPI001C611B56